MNLQKIYEELRKDYQSKGLEVEERKLRQMAWMKRDRMIWESSLSQSPSSSSSSSAGAGGGRLNLSTNNYVENDYIDDDYFE